MNAMDRDEYTRTLGDGSAATNLRVWASPSGGGHGTAAATNARAVLDELDTARARIIELEGQLTAANARADTASAVLAGLSGGMFA